MSDSLPKRIGPWRVEAEIGRGMMGVVYKAKGPRRRLAAVKIVRILFPISEEDRLRFEKRFIQEGRIVARLSHEGIVGVYDVGRDRKRVPYMALEYLEGRTLADILSEGPTPAWRESLGFVAQVAEALHHAHSLGVIHRDIKPANIMVLPSGRAKIMDFGLAKQGAGAELTSTGQFMGTPLYMSPEQALGERVDSRTDLFSLGSVAYALLTGKRAFEGDSVPHVMNRVAHQTPPAPTTVVPSLPADVDYLIARSMAKGRSDRYPTGRMLAEDVTDVLEGRPPRHRGDWTAPDPTEGTVVAARDPGLRRPDDDPLELELLDLDDEAPRGRTGSLLWLGVALVALTGILVRSPFWMDRIIRSLELTAPIVSSLRPPSAPSAASTTPSPIPPEPSSTPETYAGDDETGDAQASPAPEEDADGSSTEAVIVDEEEPEPLASPAEGAPESPLPSASPREAAADETSPGISPAPAAVETAAPSPHPSATARPSPRPMARFAIRFEHSIERGTLRVLVDRKVVLSQRLTSHVTKDLLLFKLRSGRVRDTLLVAPGKRRIRVEVRTPDEVRTKETVATFRAGRIRRLEVKIGRLRGNLSLAWR
jgi:serine/threonine protein kinase